MRRTILGLLVLTLLAACQARTGTDATVTAAALDAKWRRCAPDRDAGVAEAPESAQVPWDDCPRSGKHGLLLPQAFRPICQGYRRDPKSPDYLLYVAGLEREATKVMTDSPTCPSYHYAQEITPRDSSVHMQALEAAKKANCPGIEATQ